MTVLDTVEHNKDEKLLCRIRGFDLFACEACYHHSCRRAYVMDRTVGRNTNYTTKMDQQALEASHATAVQQVCLVVEQEIIEKQNI